MSNDQRYVYGLSAMLKMIADGDTVRLKMCPVVSPVLSNVAASADVHYAETQTGNVSPVEISLTREQCNRLITDVRALRDRVFGKDQ